MRITPLLPVQVPENSILPPITRVSVLSVIVTVGCWTTTEMGWAVVAVPEGEVVAVCEASGVRVAK